MTVPTVVLFLTAEVVARVYLVCKRGFNVAYFVTPFERPALDSWVYRYSVARSYTEWDACTGREITFTINRFSQRGPEWSLVKPDGVIRLLAVGGSTTFGTTSPEEATWPSLLQAALRERGTPAEVLNCGLPSRTAEDIVAALPAWLTLRPDAVIYYEAANNATPFTGNAPGYIANLTIKRFHRDTWLGRLIAALHYRSVLYTLLIEKIHFTLAARAHSIVPQIPFFRTQLTRLIQELRKHNVTPIFVLQVTEAPPESSFRELALDDPQAVQAAILNAVDDHLGWIDASGRDSRLWTYQTQALVEVVRRTGMQSGVQVIDPRPAFAHAARGAGLFCDMVHLRDEGNQLLARVIAEQLDLSGVAMSRQRNSFESRIASATAIVTDLRSQ